MTVMVPKQTDFHAIKKMITDGMQMRCSGACACSCTACSSCRCTPCRKSHETSITSRQ